ncbi:hypothetical protein HS088_TW04G00352 [Tripterygium wilfordii]|uniref:Pectinesterase inhibitor domain-containing protein n=1 Tax=Tripterygium wilfordii TaxID=458696 RepID=A0A7J7DQ48_TRIWF|nr:pectinesterase inhibitor 3-like [Tripterygium wilfordii]KAF5748399.1 hypothetical protein HS088_TW04G00352 [Tripterygium wilfordii]
MAPSLPLPLPAVFLLLFLSLCSAASHKSNAPHDLIRSSCVHARYPALCLRTLSSFAGPAKTPRDLAQAAVSVSLARARRVSSYLTTVSGFKSKRERVALSDCVQEISDSVDQLSRTLNELKHLDGAKFRWHVSNAETWVSAALTNDDTCLDGFRGVEGKVKEDFRKKITNLARVTSNALYMINRLDESRGH